MPIGPIILDLQGLTLSQEESEILQHPLVGGVIFFRRNYESPEQLAHLAKEIKTLRPNLVLCVDQEGGRVQRFQAGLTKLPPLRAIGELLKTHPLEQVLDIAQRCGQLMALEVRSLGVDLSFAPVLDLDNSISEIIGDRAFHSSPELVSTLATAYIKGMENCGMAATGKHFPGHGSVVLDSHLALPVDERSLDEINFDMQPFRALIANKITAIMPAHIVYPQIDPNPVGFSHYWLQTILRQQLGFAGTIVSDDLDMAGAHSMGDFRIRAQIALEAGCDFVLVCNNRAGALAILEGLHYQNNKESERRRLNLLAKGPSPSWQTLSDSPLWQSAMQSLEVLDVYNTATN
jgi:beta-N-acetylhexosaminidase